MGVQPGLFTPVKFGPLELPNRIVMSPMCQYSATEGQLDFVRGAYASRGGKSIIACPSTAANGKVSRIVARLDGPVTTPRTDTHIVITEFGWTDLKGKSSTERAKALISLAHPQFRDGLTAAAKDMHLLW